MHQYKTLAQILLILSIFNLVFGVPVVREIYDARDDLAVPTAVDHVAVMLKQQHQSRSNGARASPSSPPPDESMTSDSSPLLPSRPSPLYASSPLDGEASESLHGSPTPPGGPASLVVSSPPDEIVPGTDRPVPVRTAPILQGDTAATRTHVNLPVAGDHEAMVEMLETLAKKVVIGTSVLIISGGLILAARSLSLSHNNHWHHRAIDPDWYVSTPSRLSCRRLNVPNNKRPDLRDLLQLNS
jgi:hypothetical protein